MKDIIDAAGLPTKAGSVLRTDHRARRDAPIVKSPPRPRRPSSSARPRPPSSQPATHARTPQPLEPRSLAGRVERGQRRAAVASGMCPARAGPRRPAGRSPRPASFCGVASFKGAWGAWPLEGIVPVSQNLDHVGPMARSVADLGVAAVTLVEARLRPERAADLARRSEAIIAPRVVRMRAASPRGHRGVLPTRPSEPSALDAFKSSSIDRIEEAGAKVERLALPPSFAGMHASHGLVMAVEAAEVHRAGISRSGPHTYRPGITRLIERGLSASAVDYRAARVHQQRFARPSLPRSSTRRRGRSIALSPATVTSPPPFDDHPHRRCAVQLGVVIQRAAHLRGARRASARTACRSAFSSAPLANRSRCSRPRPGARRCLSFRAAPEGVRP